MSISGHVSVCSNFRDRRKSHELDFDSFDFDIEGEWIRWIHKGFQTSEGVFTHKCD